MFGFKSKNGNTKITEREIKEMIVYGHIEGLYKSEEKNMMSRVFKLDDLTANMIMTPKSNIIGLDLKQPDIKKIIGSRYSRIPVFNGNKDNITGVIYVKDILIELIDKPLKDIDIPSLVRKPYIINEAMKLNIILKQMRDTFEHFAFILNDSKEFIGIITLEDIIEEIVGNIYDEHDFIDELSETVNEFGYIFNGDMLISDIEGKLGIKISSSEGFKTIGEFVQSKLSLASKENKSVIQINVGSIKILSKTKDKIEKIEFKLDQNKMKD